MYKKITIAISLALQLIVGWFLLTVIVFADSHANLLESITYHALAILPYGIALAIYLRQKSIKKSVLIGTGLYFLSAVILTFLPLIDDFYVTGMGGVGLVSVSVMAVHAVILFLTLFALKQKGSENKALKKQIPIIILCLAFTFFLLGIFRTFAWNIEPSSYLALGYLDFKDVVSTAGQSVLVGIFTSFYNLTILFAFIVYTLVLHWILRNKKAELSFGKKIAIFFAPIWIVTGIYAAINQQEIRQGLVNNFANFQPVWDHRALIEPYTVELNDTSLTVWCDSEPEISEQSVVCKNRFEVALADKPIESAESVYPKLIDVGLFEKIPLHSDITRSCIYTENSTTVDGTLLMVKTERCNSRNFPVLARIEWDEFMLPLMECFGIENCQIPKSRH